MAGYDRNDTTNNIADGNVINASDLDGEFDALAAAFDEVTGHVHDGTANNGAPITKVGPAQDLVVSTGAITPKTDNTVDLGSSSYEFKDLYIDGTANIDSLVADTADINGGTVDGVTIGTNSAVTDLRVDNLKLDGNVISSTDTNGNIDLTPNGTGEVNITKVDIDSGAIDGVTIGTNSAVTDLRVDNIKIDGNTISSTDANGDINLIPNGTGATYIENADINGGAINSVEIGTTTAVTDLRVDNLKLDGNTISSTDTNGNIAITPNGTGEVDISKVDIDSGAIDGTTIGANSAAAGTFTTVNATTVDSTSLEVTNLKAKDGTAAGSIADTTGVVTLASSVLTTTDINGGTIDGAIIGGNSAAAGTFTSLTSSSTTTLNGTTIPSSKTLVVTTDIGSSVQAYDSNLTSFVSAFTLPTTDGSSGQALVTNGSGTISFGSAGVSTGKAIAMSMIFGF